MKSRTKHAIYIHVKEKIRYSLPKISVKKRLKNKIPAQRGGLEMSYGIKRNKHTK